MLIDNLRNWSDHYRHPIIPVGSDETCSEGWLGSDLCILWLPARWASGISGDHQHQCLWLYSIGNEITTTTMNVDGIHGIFIQTEEKYPVYHPYSMDALQSFFFLMFLFLFSCACTPFLLDRRARIRREREMPYHPNGIDAAISHTIDVQDMYVLCLLIMSVFFSNTAY